MDEDDVMGMVMNRKAQIICGWSGIISFALLIIGVRSLAHLSNLPHCVTVPVDRTGHIHLGMFPVNIIAAFGIAMVGGIFLTVWTGLREGAAGETINA